MNQDTQTRKLENFDLEEFLIDIPKRNKIYSKEIKIKKYKKLIKKKNHVNVNNNEFMKMANNNEKILIPLKKNIFDLIFKS